MLHVETFSLGQLETNAYLLYEDTLKRAILIDPGTAERGFMKRISGMSIEAIVLTHAHFDHIGAVDEIRKAKNCPVYLHRKEAQWLVDPALNGSLRWAGVTPPIQTALPEHELKDGQELQFLGHSFKVFHTPGHSPGSVSLLTGDQLFSGDVLFYHSVGRTDLDGGSMNQLYQSIHQKLFVLGDEVTVYPGHGPKTTIGEEKQHNPYV